MRLYISSTGYYDIKTKFKKLQIVPNILVKGAIAWNKEKASYELNNLCTILSV